MKKHNHECKGVHVAVFQAIDKKKQARLGRHLRTMNKKWGLSEDGSNKSKNKSHEEAPEDKHS